jgi:hypothetical protein
MRFSIALGLLVCCGDDAAVTCPPEYPFLRDGVCYRVTDGSVAGRDAGPSARADAGSAVRDAGEDDAGAVPGVDAGEVACDPLHPIVEGDRRFCDPGFCYCLEPDVFEACYSAETATACCRVTPDCTRTR